MRIAIAQINTKAGDIDGNLTAAIEAYDQANTQGADLVVFPELTITGYPPEDLLLRDDFLKAALEAVQTFAQNTKHCTAIIGAPYGPVNRLRNAAVVCAAGTAWAQWFKQHLPNYAVFDEKRYFVKGFEKALVGDDQALEDLYEQQCFMIGSVKVGITICEDIWVPNSPVVKQVNAGAQLLVNLSASPYYAQRIEAREELLSGIAKRAGVPLVYCNLVGGQDELVFDGGSLIFNEKGEVHSRAPQFEEVVHVTNVEIGGTTKPGWGTVHEKLDYLPEIYAALVLGTGDYVRKNGFHRVLLGLSGGVDSALVAKIAADALGPENVIGVMMPSTYSSEGSLTDAIRLAECLGIRSVEIPIFGPHAAFDGLLRPVYEALFPLAVDGVAEENIQARIRGNILMALSNKSGAMVLTTGNKSEMAMGYATLYGDMAGGFAVIKDVPKTLVFQLCDWLNRDKETIPQSIIDKPPSAELRPDQKDTDSLPTYDILDPIIEMYVETDFSASKIARIVNHVDEDDQILQDEVDQVRKICRAIDLNEYKRRQAPPGVRISPKAFGKDRRLPIANGWTQ